MGQPVKLSERLVLDARLTGEITERSIAGQIEFWARLGRAIEPLLQGIQSLALSRAGAAKRLSECLSEVDSPEGRQHLAAYLQTLPYPRYEPAEGAGLLVRTDAEGRRTIGRFVRGTFRPVKRRTPRR